MESTELRKNGFQRPWNGLQILTWCLFPMLISIYVITVFVILPTSLDSTLSPLDRLNQKLSWLTNLSIGLAINLTFLLLMLLTGLTGAYNGYLACSIDPIDPHLLSHLSSPPPPPPPSLPQRSSFAGSVKST